MHTNTISHGEQNVTLIGKNVTLNGKNVTLTGKSKITEYFLLGPILQYTLPIYIMELLF